MEAEERPSLPQKSEESKGTAESNLLLAQQDLQNSKQRKKVNAAYSNV